MSDEMNKNNEQDENASMEGEQTQEAAHVDSAPGQGYASHASSVEYGPDFYRSNASAYAKTQENRSNMRIVAFVVAFSVIIISLAGVGSFFIGKQFFQSGFTQEDASGSPSNGGNATHIGDSVVIYQTDEKAPQTDGTVASVAAKSAASVVEIMTQAESTRYPNQTVSGAGSGVIFAESIDKNYTYIITNNHVVEGYDTIVIRTTSGEEYEAVVVGTDWMTDIAVLRIGVKGLPKAQFANSDNLVLGQDVVAIGNPLGALGGSVSRGIISGLSRTISIEGVPMTLLQTDAAINPGNSGGGLFDMNGNLIGIVNAKSVGSNVDNIGFAIPGNTAKKIAADLIQFGYVSGRADLGFSFSNATTYGLTVYSYAFNNELSEAIESGHLLYSVTVQGKEHTISSVDDYRGVLALLSVGDQVQAKIYKPVRNGIITQYRSYTVMLTVHESRPVGS